MIQSVEVIGSGPAGAAIAHPAAGGDAQVLISNSRGPDSQQATLRDIGARTRAVVVKEVLDAELLVVAVPIVKVLDFGREIGDWSGQAVVDTRHGLKQY